MKGNDRGAHSARIWISFWRRLDHAYKHTTIHTEEPHWRNDDTLSDGGYWHTDLSHGPCWRWLETILSEVELPTRPRELLEIEIAHVETWEWR